MTGPIPLHAVTVLLKVDQTDPIELTTFVVDPLVDGQVQLGEAFLDLGDRFLDRAERRAAEAEDEEAS